MALAQRAAESVSPSPTEVGGSGAKLGGVVVTQRPLM